MLATNISPGTLAPVHAAAAGDVTQVARALFTDLGIEPPVRRQEQQLSTRTVVGIEPPVHRHEQQLPARTDVGIVPPVSTTEQQATEMEKDDEKEVENEKKQSKNREVETRENQAATSSSTQQSDALVQVAVQHQVNLQAVIAARKQKRARRPVIYRHVPLEPINYDHPIWKEPWPSPPPVMTRGAAALIVEYDCNDSTAPHVRRRRGIFTPQQMLEEYSRYGYAPMTPHNFRCLGDYKKWIGTMMLKGYRLIKLFKQFFGLNPPIECGSTRISAITGFDMPPNTLHAIDEFSWAILLHQLKKEYERCDINEEGKFTPSDEESLILGSRTEDDDDADETNTDKHKMVDEETEHQDSERIEETEEETSQNISGEHPDVGKINYVLKPKHRHERYQKCEPCTYGRAQPYKTRLSGAMANEKEAEKNWVKQMNKNKPHWRHLLGGNYHRLEVVVKQWQSLPQHYTPGRDWTEDIPQTEEEGLAMARELLAEKELNKGKRSEKGSTRSDAGEGITTTGKSPRKTPQKGRNTKPTQSPKEGKTSSGKKKIPKTHQQHDSAGDVPAGQKLPNFVTQAALTLRQQREKEEETTRSTFETKQRADKTSDRSKRKLLEQHQSGEKFLPGKEPGQKVLPVADQTNKTASCTEETELETETELDDAVGMVTPVMSEAEEDQQPPPVSEKLHTMEQRLGLNLRQDKAKPATAQREATRKRPRSGSSEAKKDEKKKPKLTDSGRKKQKEEKPNVPTRAERRKQDYKKRIHEQRKRKLSTKRSTGGQQEKIKEVKESLQEYKMRKQKEERSQPNLKRRLSDDSEAGSFGAELCQAVEEQQRKRSKSSKKQGAKAESSGKKLGSKEEPAHAKSTGKGTIHGSKLLHSDDRKEANVEEKGKKSGGNEGRLDLKTSRKISPRKQRMKKYRGLSSTKRRHGGMTTRRRHFKITTPPLQRRTVTQETANSSAEMVSLGEKLDARKGQWSVDVSEMSDIELTGERPGRAKKPKTGSTIKVQLPSIQKEIEKRKGKAKSPLEKDSILYQGYVSDRDLANFCETQAAASNDQGQENNIQQTEEKKHTVKKEEKQSPPRYSIKNRRIKGRQKETLIECLRQTAAGRAELEAMANAQVITDSDDAITTPKPSPPRRQKTSSSVEMTSPRRDIAVEIGTVTTVSLKGSEIPTDVIPPIVITPTSGQEDEEKLEKTTTKARRKILLSDESFEAEADQFTTNVADSMEESPQEEITSDWQQDGRSPNPEGVIPPGGDDHEVDHAGEDQEGSNHDSTRQSQADGSESSGSESGSEDSDATSGNTSDGSSGSDSDENTNDEDNKSKSEEYEHETVGPTSHEEPDDELESSKAKARLRKKRKNKAETQEENNNNEDQEQANNTVDGKQVADRSTDSIARAALEQEEPLVDDKTDGSQQSKDGKRRKKAEKEEETLSANTAEVDEQNQETTEAAEPKQPEVDTASVALIAAGVSAESSRGESPIIEPIFPANREGGVYETNIPEMVSELPKARQANILQTADTALRQLDWVMSEIKKGTKPLGENTQVAHSGMAANIVMTPQQLTELTQQIKEALNKERTKTTAVENEKKESKTTQVYLGPSPETSPNGKQ